MNIYHELLAPAGDIEKAKIALLYGADAIYIGPKSYSLRARASNFDIDQIQEISNYAHSIGKKVYIVLNVICHNEHIKNFENYYQKIKNCNIDGVICADPFIFDKIKEIDQKTPIHISTQQSISNSKAALFWKRNNAQRIILAREVNYQNLKDIIKNVSNQIEIEYFIHGAVCIANSGRCMMSNNFSLRDSNIGGCAHSCRWNYDILNYQSNTKFTMSAKDMNLSSKLNDLIKLDIASFKIEGRMKSMHYLAVVISNYRKIIDSIKNKQNPEKINEYIKQIQKAENRKCSTGCFENKSYDKMLYSNNETVNQSFAFIVNKKIDQNKYEIISKNKFSIDQKFEAICYDQENFIFKIKKIYDKNGHEISVININSKKFVIEIDKKYPELKPYTIVDIYKKY